MAKELTVTEVTQWMDNFRQDLDNPVVVWTPTFLMKLIEGQFVHLLRDVLPDRDAARAVLSHCEEFLDTPPACRILAEDA